MSVAEWQVQNFKRVVKIGILEPPKSGLFAIQGQNRQGKSSLIETLPALLRGAREVPDEAVRFGEDEANARISLGELIVERRITNDRTTLKVTSKEGYDVPSPQSVLDAMTPHMKINPTEFAFMKERERVELLKEVAGIDFSELDEERERVYMQRRDVNRDLKDAKANQEAIVLPNDCPTQEASVSDVLSEIKELRQEQDKNARAKDERDHIKESLSQAQERVAELERQLQEAKEKAADLEGRLTKANAYVEDLPNLAPEIEALEKRAEQVEEHNKNARKHKRKKLIGESVDELSSESQRLTDRLDEIDRTKEQMIREADLPLEGLTFDEDTIRYNGARLDQISQSERVVLAALLAAAMIPEDGVPIIAITEGDFLDDATVRDLDSKLKERGVLAFIERRESSDLPGIVIEEGRIKGDVDGEVAA